MEPRIVEKEAFWVMGVGVRGNPMQLDYGDIWGRQFGPFAPALMGLSTDGACYGVYFGTGEQGIVDMIAGVAVAADAPVVEGLVKRELPASTYAVFECRMAEIGQTWGYIEGQWKPASEYEGNPEGGCFELFTTGDNSPNAPVVIYTAVRKKG